MVQQQSGQREKLASERAEIIARLHSAQRLMSAESGFQAKYRHAVQSDLTAREAELDKVYDLEQEHSRAKQEIAKSRAAYVDMSREEMQAMLDARLVKKDTVVNANYQLSQLANANLTLAEKEAEIQNRKAQLEREISALSTAPGPRAGRRPGSERNYTTLRMEEDYTRSMMALP